MELPSRREKSNKKQRLEYLLRATDDRSELSNREASGSNPSEAPKKKWRVYIKMNRRRTGGRSGMKEDEGGVEV
jgi:hypothetical protein